MECIIFATTALTNQQTVKVKTITIAHLAKSLLVGRVQEKTSAPGLSQAQIDVALVPVANGNVVNQNGNLGILPAHQYVRGGKKQDGSPQQSASPNAIATPSAARTFKEIKKLHGALAGISVRDILPPTPATTPPGLEHGAGAGDQAPRDTREHEDSDFASNLGPHFDLIGPRKGKILPTIQWAKQEPPTARKWTAQTLAMHKIPHNQLWSPRTMAKKKASPKEQRDAVLLRWKKKSALPAPGHARTIRKQAALHLQMCALMRTY